MGRTSINLPDDLQGRMRSVEEPVNWSLTAAECFERKLSELAAQREVSDMSAVIERLRASKMGEGDEDHREGFKAGAGWAEQYASYKELERVEAYAHKEWAFEEVEGNAYSVAEQTAAFIINGNLEDVSRPEADEFWESVAGENAAPSASFCEGFCEGASDVLAKVSDRL